MRSLTISKSILRNPVSWFVAWGMLVGAYVLSLQYGLFVKEWDGIVYFLQLAADICIGVFSYLAYKNRVEKVAKKFYLLLFVSLIPGLFANEIYNILINIIQIVRNDGSSLYWTIAYTLFLLVQSYAWYCLLRKKIRVHKKKGQKWLTVYPYLGSGLIIFLSLIFIMIINRGTFKQINIDGVFNSLLEILAFTLMSINLSRTKNKSLIYVEMGFLLLIGFNFAHRFSDVLSTYYKVFDVVWLSCLIVIIYGLYVSFKKGKEKIQFFEENSIHVLTSGAFILFANFILVVFAIAAFGLATIQIDKIQNLKILLLDIPSALVFSYSLTVLLAKLLAWRLSRPLDRIVQRISKITESNGVIQQDQDDRFEINEVQMLEKFIVKTISELRHANYVKSEFLMNISHDFRTPASGILYMSRLIHDRIPDDGVKNLQKMVVNSSEQLMALLDDVLDYSRLENDKLKLNNQSFDVVLLINELIAFMSAKVQESGLTITANYTQDKIIYYSDRTVIQRIVLNLLSNAIKFTHSGEVQISVSINDIDSRKWLVIKIKDTGIGIDSANQKNIFDPFYRIEPANSSKYPGIGLGLSNVNLMLKKISGRITLESELGLGSTFCILLPTT